MPFLTVLVPFGSWISNNFSLTRYYVIHPLSFPLQSLLELEVDLDNLELEDIDTTDINLDEDILDDWVFPMYPTKQIITVDRYWSSSWAQYIGL